MNENWKINIEPETNIYNIFKRYSYKTETAIAEFIDNSTASYFEHFDELKTNNPNYKLKIYVLYINTNENKTSSIWIKDNAYGMNKENFTRALRINEKPVNRNSRNEFGLGLKTAGIWFANQIKIYSTEFGSGNRYITKIDINDLEENKPKDINVITKKVEDNNFGTTIILKNLDKTFKTKTIKQKLINHLSSVYRKDLETGNVEIICAEYKTKENCWFDFNGNSFGHDEENYKNIPSIKFEEPVLMKGPISSDSDFQSKLLRKEFEDIVTFENQKFPIKGWIGILKTSSRSKSGFALFRRGRVIVGGTPNEGYKPQEIFGQKGSFSDIRLIGEVNMDTFPVNQAKDGFSWDGDLQDAFDEVLLRHSKEYKTLALKIRTTIDANTNFFNNEKQIKKENEIIERNLSKIMKNNISVNTIKDNVSSDIVDHTVFSLEENSIADSKIHFYISNEKIYKQWLDISFLENSDYKVILYINHPFLKPQSENTDFIQFIRKFIQVFSLSFIYAEKNGLGISSIIKYMNKLLEEYATNV